MKITVRITPAGDVAVSVNGIAGPACSARTQRLEQALGAVSSDVKTDEYYEEARAAQARSQDA